MRQASLASVLAIGTFLAATSTILPDISQAQSTTFYCGTTQKSIPTTIARTPRGDVAVIRWVSKHFKGAGYTPKKRCSEVSKRFQNFHERNLLNFVSAGYLNGLPVICVGNNNPCTADRVLFTLKPGQNAARELQQLFNIQSGASTAPLYESSGGSNPDTVINMTDFLANAPVIQSSSQGTARPVKPASQPSSKPAPQPSRPTGGNLW